MYLKLHDNTQSRHRINNDMKSVCFLWLICPNNFSTRIAEGKPHFLTDLLLDACARPVPVDEILTVKMNIAIHMTSHWFLGFAIGYGIRDLGVQGCCL